MWRQFSLLFGFRFSIIVFLSILPDTTAFISEINLRVNNTPCRDLRREGFVYHNSINIILEWYPPIYELVIAMACSLYTISTHFEKRIKFKIEI